jgi:hypothetical protein
MIKLRRWRRSWRVLLSALLLCMWLRTSIGLLREYPVQRRRILSTARKMSSDPKNLIVVISGPTGVGKSDVAAHLCAIQKGMIVSADSVQQTKCRGAKRDASSSYRRRRLHRKLQRSRLERGCHICDTVFVESNGKYNRSRHDTPAGYPRHH